MKKVLLSAMAFMACCITANAQFVETIAGNGNPAHLEGNGINASFNRPHDVAMDNAGNIYVTDQFNHCIRKIAPGGQVTTIAGNPGVSGNQDGIGTAALFNNPTGIAYYNNYLYVSDYSNHTIRIVSLFDFAVITILGNGSPGDTDGIGNNAQLGGPVGICLYSSTELLFTEQVNHKIKKLNLTNNSVTTFAGNGTPGSTEGPALSARFNAPYDVFASAGVVVVADQTNHKIRLIQGGNVSTFAGTGVAGNTTGPTLNSQFHTPLSLIGNENGDLFVLDYGTSMIRKIDQTAQVTNVVGSGNQFADGDFTTAKFNQPTGMTMDNDGNLIVADHMNHRIRKVHFTGTLGMNDIQKPIFEVSPNPANDFIAIQTQENVKQVRILSLTGEEVLVSDSKEISIQGLPAGVYLVSVETENGTTQQRFVKE